MGILAAIIIIFVMMFFGALVNNCRADSPDAYFRMSGCSGGWISTERGLWGVTCRHCVSRPGDRVRITLFKDGHRSRKINGVCYASHPQYDCSIIYVAPENYPYSELPETFPLSPDGPGPNSTVFAIGSFAGGTINPAIRKCAVTGFRSSGYEFTINDAAWGGHSGGPVVDAETGYLVGVLWGDGRNYSSVTSSRAIWETLYGGRSSSLSKSSERPTSTGEKKTEGMVVSVYGTDAALAGFLRDWNRDQNMFGIEWRRMGSTRIIPRFEWIGRQHHRGGRIWYTDGWPGCEKLFRKFKLTGVQESKYCPKYPQQFGSPFGNRGGNPWNKILPPSPSVPQNNAEIEALLQKLRDLEEIGRKAKRDAEDELRRLKNQAEDDARNLKNDAVDAARKLRDTLDDERRKMFRERDADPRRDSDDGSRKRGVDIEDVFDAAIKQHNNEKERVNRRERTLVRFSNDVQRQVDSDDGPAGKDFYLPGALVLASLLGGGAYMKGKGKEKPSGKSGKDD